MSLESQNQLKTLQDNGVLKLSNVLNIKNVYEVKLNLWNKINDTFQIFIDDPMSWFSNTINTSERSGAARLNGMKTIMSELKHSGNLDKLELSITNTLANIYKKNNWTPIGKWYSLLSFPGSEKQWNIPYKTWHSDEPNVSGDSQPWSLFAFVFLDKVTLDMGPTLTITGSQRYGQLLVDKIGTPNEALINAFKSVNDGLIKNPKEVKLLPLGQLIKSLEQIDPWYKKLIDEDSSEQRVEYFMKDGSINQGINQKVIELTGEAGDIILMDPRCLHTSSANISKLPRQILRLDFKRNK